MDLFERTQKKKSQQGQRGQGPWLVLRKNQRACWEYLCMRNFLTCISVISSLLVLTWFYFVLQKNYKDLFASSSSSDSSGMTLTQQERKQAQLQAYLHAIGGVRKNRIVGIPRVFAVIPTRYTQTCDGASCSQAKPKCWSYAHIWRHSEVVH